MTQRGGASLYGELARALRRCRGTRRDGQPCRGWALWGSPAHLCAAHTYPTRRTYSRWHYPRPYDRPTNAEPCRCAAYNWPHRPGSGICRWPDSPAERCTIPAGTKAWYKQ